MRHPEIREVRRSDFCGHYIGESGPKTNELIEKSLGRIIFMDEFYSLIEIVEIGHRYATPRASLLDVGARKAFLRNYTTPGGQHGIDAMQHGRFARNVIEHAAAFGGALSRNP